MKLLQKETPRLQSEALRADDTSLANTLAYSKGVPYSAFDIDAVRQIRHLLHFNRKARNAIVRRFVAIILKNKIEEFRGDDGRKKQLQEWEIHGIWAIIRLWDVDENLKWLSSPHSFSGMWRRTWRDEIKKKSGITSDYMINHLLARMEDHGLISRRHPMCSNSKARELWIMLHADRVVGIVDQANEIAKKDTKFGRLMKIQKHVKLVDKNKSVSGSIVEEKQDRQILPSHVKGFTEIDLQVAQKRRPE